METLSVVQSLLIALWVAVVMSRWLGGGATLTLRFSPLMTGLVVGLIVGEVAQAMIVTAALQMIYMGVFSPGGSMPAEPSIAAAIAVPVALLGICRQKQRLPLRCQSDCSEVTCISFVFSSILF